MTDVKPVLNQLNIVAKDFDATIEFYRRLGVDVNLVGDAESSDGIRHAEATLPNGFVLEFDNPVLARTYNASWRRSEGSRCVLIGFSLCRYARPSISAMPTSLPPDMRADSRPMTRFGARAMPSWRILPAMTLDS